MKPLKPSHREKKRYILIKGKDVSRKNIENSISEFVGVLGYADACPQIVKSKREEMVLCINRKSLDKVRTSFLMSGKDIKIERVSGTIGKLKNNN